MTKKEKPQSKSNKLNPLPPLPGEDLKHFKALDGTIYEINMRQRLFCDLWLENLGNGTKAAIDAGYNVYNKYGKLNSGLAKVIAYENLTKPHLIAYIKTKMSKNGFNDENVDNQTLYVIDQMGDLQAKCKGISIYNKLKGRDAPEKVEHSGQVEVVEVMKYGTNKDQASV